MLSKEKLLAGDIPLAAKAHVHRRIIYAIPFAAIIDQTAAIFRKVPGDEIVLEHHSAIEEEFEPKEAREGRDKLKLAMEDWAAPGIVTSSAVVGKGRT